MTVIVQEGLFMDYGIGSLAVAVYAGTMVMVGFGVNDRGGSL